MNYGLYLSASGVLTNLYRQDVYANNLANVQTAGFKRDLATVAQRSPEAIEGHFSQVLRQKVLDQLGGGVLAGTQHIEFSTAAPTASGNPLHAALTDDHQFFVVRKTDANTGEQAARLTRDGRFTVDSQRRLVSVTNGLPVLDGNDQPIFVPGEGPASLTPDGRVMQNGEQVGQLQVTFVADPSALRKEGQNLMRFEGVDGRRPAAVVNLLPEHYEASGVDPIRELMNMVSVTKAVTDNANLIRYHDLLMDRAVNTLGRVA